MSLSGVLLTFLIGQVGMVRNGWMLNLRKEYE